MANMKKVNILIKKRYPNLEIEAVRGDGYVYFIFGIYDIDSLYVHPVSTSTNDLASLAIEQIDDFLIGNLTGVI